MLLPQERLLPDNLTRLTSINLSHSPLLLPPKQLLPHIRMPFTNIRLTLHSIDLTQNPILQLLRLVRLLDETLDCGVEHGVLGCEVPLLGSKGGGEGLVGEGETLVEEIVALGDVDGLLGAEVGDGGVVVGGGGVPLAFFAGDGTAVGVWGGTYCCGGGAGEG